MDGDDGFSEDDDLEMLLERNDEGGDVDNPAGTEADTNNDDVNVATGGNEDENQNENATGDGDSENRKKVPPKKKIVRNPQPKLNADRICGKQGIALMPKMFESTKFKGKGHEKEDLNKMMGMIEHWAHRLFPQLPFDIVLDRIERLGSKKPVQVYIKKMRMDMLVEDDDRPIVDSDDDNEMNTDRNDTQVDARNPDDLFEELLREAPFNPDASLPTNRSYSSTIQQSEPSPSTSSAIPLSDELRQKIERNRQLALERKRARESQLASSTADSTTEPVVQT